jgi:hypothetical protein
MTYTETVTSDGETHTGALSDLAALRLVQRGQRLRYQVTAAKDGTVTVVRKRENRAVVTVVVRPDTKPARLTKTQYTDLELIRLAHGIAEYRDGGRIAAALRSIPPAAARRLRERGLILGSPAAGASVAVSLAGRLAMAAYEHRVYTVGGTEAVTGDFENHDFFSGRKVERTGYFVTGYCSCGRFASTQTERESARRAARTHLEEHLTATLIGA